MSVHMCVPMPTYHGTFTDKHAQIGIVDDLKSDCRHRHSSMAQYYMGPLHLGLYGKLEGFRRHQTFSFIIMLSVVRCVYFQNCRFPSTVAAVCVASRCDVFRFFFYVCTMEPSCEFHCHFRYVPYSMQHVLPAHTFSPSCLSEFLPFGLSSVSFGLPSGYI